MSDRALVTASAGPLAAPIQVKNADPAMEPSPVSTSVESVTKACQTDSWLLEEIKSKLRLVHEQVMKQRR